VRGLVRGIIAFRWPLLVALVLLSAAATVLVVRGLRFDFSPRSLFLTHDEEIEYIEEFRARFGAEDASFMVLLHAEPDQLWSEEGLTLLGQLTEALGALENVAEVTSLTNVWVPLRHDDGSIEHAQLLGSLDPESIATARRTATESPLLLQRLVNGGGDTTVVVVRFAEGLEEELERRPTLDAADQVVADLIQPPYEGVAMGLPQAQREYAILLPRDLLRNSILSVILISIFIWILFRSWSAIAVSNAAVGMALVWVLALMVLTDHPVDMVNSVITSLVLVIGVSEAVHLLTRYRELLAAGKPRAEALRIGVSRVALACLLTAVTSAVGFASLYTAKITVIRVLGIFAATGIMFAFVTAIILVPACFTFLPAPPAEGPGIANRGLTGRWTDWVGSYVTSDRGRKVTWVVSLIVTLVSIVGITRLDANNFLLEEMWPHNRMRVANDFAEQNFGGVLPVEIEITVPEDGGMLEPEVLQATLALQDHLDQDPYIARGLSFADLVAEAHLLATGDKAVPDSAAQIEQELFLFSLSGDVNPVEQYVDPEYRHARISTSALDWGSDHFNEWHTELDAKASEVFPDGVDVHVTGAILIANNALSHIVGDTFRSLTTAFVIISILMSLLFRSVKIGVLAMVPNLLPLIVTLGVMGYCGITIRTSMVLIFALSLGVAVDDTIHILARYRQELEVDGDIAGALRRSVATTGQAIVFASTLLVAGFSIFLFSSFYGLFQFGFLGAITITTALLADLFLTPAMIQTFGLRVKGVGERRAQSS